MIKRCFSFDGESLITHTQNPAAIQQALKAEELFIPEFRQRLSFFKYFAGSNNLRCVVRRGVSVEQSGTSLMQSGLAVTTFADATETTVAIQWLEAIQLRDRNELVANVRWSFGDPANEVMKLSRRINAVVGELALPVEVEAEKAHFDKIVSFLRF
jgi:hypothetical protein